MKKKGYFFRLKKQLEKRRNFVGSSVLLEITQEAAWDFPPKPREAAGEVLTANGKRKKAAMFF